MLVANQDEIRARTKKDDGVVSITFSAVPGGVGAALLAAFISRYLDIYPAAAFMGILVTSNTAMLHRYMLLTV